MPYELLQAPAGEVWLKISGLVGPEEFGVVQAQIRARSESAQPVRMLVLLEGFTGWSDAEAWAETAFLSESECSRIAVVGERRWEDEVMLFSGQPLRQTEMAFFAPGELAEAKAWLSA